ncbi:hypothetical protein [Salinibacterium sp. PAMC 21357]|nr:hypothetical protein [Salinibacterium sp. PAMC 21357]
MTMVYIYLDVKILLAAIEAHILRFSLRLALLDAAHAPRKD